MCTIGIGADYATRKVPAQGTLQYKFRPPQKKEYPGPPPPTIVQKFSHDFFSIPQAGSLVSS